MVRLSRKRPADKKLPSEAEEHLAEVVILSAAVPADARLLPEAGASHPHALTRGGQAAALYLWGLRTPDEKTPAWESQVWALNTAARALGGRQASWDNMDWTRARYAHIKALQGVLAARYASSTANRILGAVRSVLEEAYRNRLYDREELERIKLLDPVKGSRLPPGRLLEIEEISKLLRGCLEDTTARGARDAALFGCLYGCGLRRAEASRLLVEKLSTALLQLSVVGKGNKERLVPFGPLVLPYFYRWILVRGNAAGPFLCRTLRWGNVMRRDGVPVGILPGGVWEVVSRRSIELGMEPFTPHDLRRSYITHLLDEGADVVAVQKLVGHSDPVTTAGYDRRPAERLREFAAGLPFPDLLNGTEEKHD